MWMFGSRTTVKKVRNSLTWFSHKEGQSVYGPSLAPMEATVAVPSPFGGTETLQVTALGRSKAAHEFLVLH